jgi:RNA polymerase sigma factor (sigma-70 family)
LRIVKGAIAMRQEADGPPEGLRPLSPALVAILAEVHADFLGFLRKALGSTSDAEDVMQQFYLRVLTHSADLRRQTSARIWLRRVLRSVLNDHLRRVGRRKRAEADFARKEIATPLTEEDIDAFICMCLHKLLPVLKPHYAEVLRLVDLQQMPRPAAASHLGLSLNALTVRLHRARQAMRRALELTCATCPVHGYLDCACEYTKRLKKNHATTER